MASKVAHEQHYYKIQRNETYQTLPLTLIENIVRYNQ